ncbi:hypothetical protein HOD29_00740 [archaeon]|jgi:hypothetical protein|nr:hypothetical protein [archaeon]
MYSRYINLCLAILILVFAIWKNPASDFVIIIAATLLFVEQIYIISKKEKSIAKRFERKEDKIEPSRKEVKEVLKQKKN